jgi:hypothetical protein
LQNERNKIIKSRLLVKPVTETEKIEVFRAIRWSFMSHEQLIEVSMDKEFELAREMIL